VLLGCKNVVYATGGPAGMYADSVFPVNHYGATGLALEAGALGKNLTEWQYGLASVRPRWNVSGTYMQVLPRFVSVDEAGTEREFLLEFFDDPVKALNAVFLKGYQWPFDSKKVMEGSSVIDLLVYREQVNRGRKVYLDYCRNPFGLKEIPFEDLSREAYQYLSCAESCFGTPIERLKKMNQPAIDLYRSKGLDLEKEYLQIALCAQHCNGGIAVDAWWQTEIPGLFAAGECAGTHGVSRPGGSALNAGQVGSLRAAQYICARGRKIPQEAEFAEILQKQLDSHRKLRAKWERGSGDAAAMIHSARRRMSDHGGPIRNAAAIEAVRQAVVEEQILMDVRAVSPAEAVKAYQLRDLLVTQYAMLTALADFAKTAGGTRGSALYTDPSGQIPVGLEEKFRFLPVSENLNWRIQQVRLGKDGCAVLWRDVRPIPEEKAAFETVWRQYRENRNIY
jgi:succinate dehydrogenase/fumarate reductase flavoprotein subunit